MSLNIDYYITERCNFSCEYCYRNEHKNETYEPTKDNIDKMLDNLKNYQIKYFTILGGEPSISNNTLYLIEKLSNVKYIRIISNGSNKKFFNSLYNMNLKNIILDISYHPYYNNQDDMIYLKDLFKDNMRVKILLDSRYTNNIIDFLSKYSLHKNDVFQTIDCKQTYKYTTIELYKLIHSKFNIPLQELMYYNTVVDKQFRNKMCYNNYVIISKDGYASYPYCFKHKIRYNIYEDCEYVHNVDCKQICTYTKMSCAPKCYEQSHDL